MDRTVPDIDIPTKATRLPLAVLGLTLAAMLAFAANSLLCRAALAGHHVDATTFTAIRFTSGAATLAVLARSRGGDRALRRFAWGSGAALFAYAIAFSLAYVRIPAAVGALLLFGAVQVTMIGAGWTGGERPRPVEWVGLLASIAGLVVLTAPGLARPDPLGAILMLIAGVAWGLYTLRGRRGGNPVVVNAASFARALPMAVTACAIPWTTGNGHADAIGIALAVGSGALASALGYAAWYAALPRLSATRAAIVQLSVPPIAAVGGVVLLGEVFTTRIVLAGVLVLGGIALALRTPRTAR